MGLVEISNEITLRMKPSVSDLSRSIRHALTRQPLGEARDIQVDVDGSTVKLSG